MNLHPIFPSGLELANLVINSNLLNLSFGAISALQSEIDPYQQQPFSIKLRVFTQFNLRIVAFVPSPLCAAHHLQQGGDLVSSETLKHENFDLFDFLCSKGSPSFSINRAAIALFYQHLGDLSAIKNQLVDSSGKLLVENPLIITGNSLGGSVASLFTLWVLDSINQPSRSKRPLCITFGSPLIGNLGLQKAVAERSSWNSCFLNVAANQDLVPSLYIPPQSFASALQTILYRPFGAFILCSQISCTCVDDPEEVVLLLDAMGLESRMSHIADEDLLTYYGSIVKNLETRLLLKGSPVSRLLVTDSVEASIILQLEAIGDRTMQQPQHNMGITTLITKLKDREHKCMLNKRKALSPSRKLNDIKIKMAYLEWYKKTCKAKNIGYYDSYKNQVCNKHMSTSDIDVARHKKFLTKYWVDMVEEAEKKPQKEGAFIRLMWLFAGTNYRRMVEPLDIAEYYANGKRNYEAEGRSKHYILLDKWQRETAEKPTGSPSKVKKQNVAGNLTNDSCFWAKVEEALISCGLFKDATSDARVKQSSGEYLVNFEHYVMDQIKNYAISPEIFLRGSSFMKWWNGYKDIASNYSLIDFMTNCRSLQYENGIF